MRITLQMLYTKSWRDIAKITVENIVNYCVKHGYNWNIQWLDEPYDAFEKIRHIQRLFEANEADVVMSLDCDLMITNYTVKVEDFLDEYDDDIRREAKAAGIPYAIKAGQILTEASVSGRMSRMATQINNLGGIKCPSNCSLGEGHHGIYKDDTDHDKFRRFATPLMFFKYHNQFLQNNERYNRCFECGEDIECWLLRLQQSGYATHKSYDKLIASVINYYRLSNSPVRYNRAATIKRLTIKF